MSDSPPNRRSSIPILKQSNKTKSFQSYVNLNLNNEEHVTDGKSRSSSTSPPIENVVPSKLKSPPVKHNFPQLEIDNDIVITKLCEENKRLKDHQTQLISKYEEALRENMEIQNKNDELQRELMQVRRESADRFNLQRTVENLQKQQIDMVEKNKKLQKKLEEILPESIKDEVEATSTLNGLDGLIMELEKLKSYLNNVELQLYEANEHISDLLEKKQELEAENIAIKAESAELNNLTKLMQANMYETLSTSKRMEETFLRVKNERDELIKKHNRDSTDGKTTTTTSVTSPSTITTVTEEIANLKMELKRQKTHYEAQFIEYKQTVEKEMDERINSELESLKIQNHLLETELEISRMRAESAEEELRQLKATLRLSASKLETLIDAPSIETLPPPPPPPPPPPMPSLLLRTQNTNTIRSRSNPQTLSDALSEFKLQPAQSESKETMKIATGLEAVIADLKSGKVTLRRRHNQPKPTIPLSPKENFSNIYELIEKNKKQNRNSKKILDNELSTVFKKFNLNI